MASTSPKGLFTSLVLFITLGLFGLATLFTLLMLEVRSGQQQLNRQLATLSGTPLPAAQTDTNASPSSPIDSDAFNQLRATIELIASRQRPAASSQFNALSQQLEQLQEQLGALQQAVATGSAKPAESPRLSEIEQSLTTQQRQLNTILERQQSQAVQQHSITESLQLLATSASNTVATVAPPSPDDPLLREQLQQMAAQLTQQGDTNQRVEQQLNTLSTQLSSQQQSFRSSQNSLKVALEEVLESAQRPPPAPALEPLLEPLQKQLVQIDQRQQSLLNRQQELQQMVQSLARQVGNPAPASAPAALSPQQLEAISSQLQQLTRQPQQMERNLMKPAGQSNTIRPYSYNAR